MDLQSLLVFGFDIDHWVRRNEWLRLLQSVFGPPILHRRSPQALDLFSATRID